MATYLGETDVSASDAHYGAFTPRDWALEFLEMYAGIDGAHQKQWLLDTLARILLGAPVTVHLARWSNGTAEHRFSVGTSEEYRAWVREYNAGGECRWRVGTPP